jgi:hypothetical protein
MNPNTRRSFKLRAELTTTSAALLGALVLVAAIFAQSPNAPKLARSHPAFSPRDFSGVWMERENAITFSDKEPPLQPWAAAKFKTVKPGYGPHAVPDSEDPILDCLAPGVPRIMLIPFPMQIVQTPGEVIMLFEYDHYSRHIFLDRQVHQKDVDSSWMGDSIGRWDRDTLIVDTIGMNDKTWLDQVGHPHSDALHVIERIRRVDRDTLQDDVTIDDPHAYTKPWTGQQVFKLRPAWHLIEYVCEDNMARSRK